MGLKRPGRAYSLCHPLISGLTQCPLPPPPYLFLYLFRPNLSFPALTIESNMSSPYPAYGRPPRGASNPYMYPPDGASVPYSLNDSSTTIHGKYEFNANRVSRTPSPTPSEAAELARDGVIDWKTMRSWRFWLRREWLCALKIVSHSALRTFLANGLSFPSSRVLCACCPRHYDNPFPNRIPPSNRRQTHSLSA
jgi:hypothetical protein